MFHNGPIMYWKEEDLYYELHTSGAKTTKFQMMEYKKARKDNK